MLYLRNIFYYINIMKFETQVIINIVNTAPYIMKYELKLFHTLLLSLVRLVTPKGFSSLYFLLLYAYNNDCKAKKVKEIYIILKN